MLRRASILIVAGCIWAGSGGAGTGPAEDTADRQLDELLGLYVGTYLSRPDQGARDDRPVLMRVVAVDPPPGRRHALYAEMRHDGVDGEIYRQSLLVFDEDPERAGNTMTSLAFTDRQAAAALIDDPGLLAAGRLGTTSVLGPGCTTRFEREGEGFLGRIDPRTCVITGKRGDTRHIEAQVFLRRDAIEQLERGYAPDGQLLFGNRDGVRYVWPRVEAAETRR